MFDRFRARAEAANAEVHRFASGDEALDFVVRFLRDEDIAAEPGRRAVWAAGTFPDDAERQRLESLVPGLTFRVTRETAAGARVGITAMEWSLADTGTLAQPATSVEQLLASSLPTIHLALAATERILPDLPAFLARIDPRGSGYLSLITGPSRTADIERVLTIGVHGPERLVIVCVDEPGGLVP